MVAEREEPARGSWAGGSRGAVAAAAGRQAPLLPEAVCVPLTRLTVGMWASRNHRDCQLLLLPEQQQLVVLCDRRTTVIKSPSRFSLTGLTAKSPFASGHTRYRHAGCVHAFELPFSSIGGLDFSNSLCLDGRLVLEVHHLRKREFPTMEAARDYFLEPPTQPHHCPRNPTASSLAGMAAVQPAGSSQLQARLHPLTQAGSAERHLAAGANGGSRSAQLHGSSSARGNLMHKLGVAGAACSNSQPLGTAVGSSNPLTISGAAAGAAAAGAVEGAAAVAALAGNASLPESPRSSFESDLGSMGYVSSPGSATSGFMAAPVVLTAVAAAAAAAGQGGQPCRTLSPSALQGTSDGGGGRLGSWDGLAADGIAVGTAKGGIQGCTGVPAEAVAGPEQSPARCGACARQQPLLRVGSGSGPSSTAGTLSSPPSPQHQTALHTAGQQAGPGMRRVASDSQMLTASSSAGGAKQSQQQQQQPQQQRPQQLQDEGGGDQEEAAGWPAAHAFTAVSKVYQYRTVVVNWTDPRLPGLLRPIVQGNERLLKLYESGLPSWAVYCPQYGLFYRPWLRTVTWLLFYAFSVFSFAMGFYDLYKNLPGLQSLMQRLMAGMWLPPAAVLEWFEQHTQIRLSILLTYLFGKSEAFVWVMRWAHNFARVTTAALQPLLDFVGPPAAAVGQAVRLAGGQTWQALSALGLMLAAIFTAGIAPLAAMLLECWAAVGAALLPLVQALQQTTVGPLLWVGEGLQQLGAASGAVWRVLLEGGSGVAAGVAALVGTARAGRAVGGATSHAIAEQALWLYVLPADALEVLRTSAVKAAKSAQAVAKFCLQICGSLVRHRLTLELRAGRAWRRAKQRLRAAIIAPLRALAALLKWLWVAVRLLIVDVLVAGRQTAVNQDQQEESPQQQEQQAVEFQQQPEASASAPTNDTLAPATAGASSRHKAD